MQCARVLKLIKHNMMIADTCFQKNKLSIILLERFHQFVSRFGQEYRIRFAKVGLDFIHNVPSEHEVINIFGSHQCFGCNPLQGRKNLIDSADGIIEHLAIFSSKALQFIRRLKAVYIIVSKRCKFAFSMQINIVHPIEKSIVILCACTIFKLCLIRSNAFKKRIKLQERL